MAEAIQGKKKADAKTKESSNLMDKYVSLKREAYVSLDQALTFDSNTTNTSTKIDTCIILYERCLKFIEQALAFYDSNRPVLSSQDDAVKIYNQLVSMKRQTTDRLGALKDERVKMGQSSAAIKKPAVEKKSSLNEEFLDLGEQILSDDDCIIIDDIGYDSNANNSKLTDKEKLLSDKLKQFPKASEILRLDNGVQMFYIADDGTVSTPSYPTTLSIYSFDQNDVGRTSSGAGKNIVGFVRVDSWLYPLVPNELPAMKTNFNAYIFPNNEEQSESDKSVKCSFIGITLANQLDEENKQLFEDVLSNYGLLIHQNREDSAAATSQKRPIEATISRPSAGEQQTRPMEIISDVSDSDLVDEEDEAAKKEGLTADRIAKGLVTGAQYASQGIATTTEYASKYIKIGAEKLKTQIQPNEQAAQVDPKVKSIMQNVRYGTHVGVRVSSFMVNKLGQLATYTAKTVGPTLRQGSTALLSKTGIAGDKASADGYVDSFCTVAKGSIQSYGIVYDSLEKAAKTLGKNFTDHTVTVVEHKYGPDAGQVTRNGLCSVGNVAVSVNNFRDFKVVRTVAKATAKEVISSKSSQNIANNNSFQTKIDNKKNNENPSLK